MQLIEYVRAQMPLDEFEARGIILAGKVYVNNEVCIYGKREIKTEDTVIIRYTEKKYVTRAGFKLEKALAFFAVDANDKVCLDIGAAEGGFTDCLLKNHARRVYAVDVAYGIFDWNLRNDERVVVLERTNARYLDEDKIKEKCDLMVSDVSFISIRKILPRAKDLLKNDGTVISLYKPQFELPRKYIGKNGNIEKPEHISEAIAATVFFLQEAGIYLRNITSSPIRGNNGNIEFLLSGDKDGGRSGIIDATLIGEVVAEAFADR